MPGGWAWDDDDEAARRDAENGVRQAQRLIAMIEEAVRPGAVFRLTPEMIRELNRLAVDGRTERPGEYRDRDVEITASFHEPPSPAELPSLVERLCADVNDGGGDAVYRAAYVMWRLNWIHPFAEGNGRTARAVSYLVLCAGVGRAIPGEKTLVERCVAEKRRYYRCLEAADRAAREGRTDVSEMQTFLQELLDQQIAED